MRFTSLYPQLTPEENAAIVRYRFLGKNYFPSPGEMDRLMQSAGFSTATTHPVGNKLWHRYYPVQSFGPASPA